MSRLTAEEKKKYIANRVVPLTNDIDGGMFGDTAEIVEELLLAGSPDIVVIISSLGGDSSAALDIYDILDTYPGSKTAVVYSAARSGAAVIFQACDERLCARHADILVHDVAADLILTDAHNPRKLAKWIRERDKTQAKIDRIFCERTSLPMSKIRALTVKNKKITASEALKYNLIDRILTKADMAKHFRPGVLEKISKAA